MTYISGPCAVCFFSVLSWMSADNILCYVSIMEEADEVSFHRVIVDYSFCLLDISKLAISLIIMFTTLINRSIHGNVLSPN